MVKDLISISSDEIELSAERSVQKDNTTVIYLHNNGDPEYELKKEDMDVWIKEDIDD